MAKIVVGEMALHESARRLDNEIATAAGQWAYAVTIPFPAGEGQTISVTASVDVRHGRLGVGVVNAAGSAFLIERTVGPGIRHVTLTALRAEAGALVFRNVSPDGESRFVIHSVEAHEVARAPYPVHVASRLVSSEPIPAGGGTVVFDDDAASAINVARMNFIRALGVSFAGKRVLDIGAGVGHFSRLYTSLGAEVVAIEGRDANVAELLTRYPEVAAHVGDAQSMDLAGLGRFDVVHCFGLLYHLDSPVAALRRMEAVCGDILLLETMVCDAYAPVMLLADETMAVNQALAGLGCRPSPSFVALALNRIGFPFVYGAAQPPAHVDFTFEWMNSLESSRDGHNLRSVFVASRRPLESAALVPLIEPD